MEKIKLKINGVEVEGTPTEDGGFQDNSGKVYSKEELQKLGVQGPPADKNSSAAQETPKGDAPKTQEAQIQESKDKAVDAYQKLHPNASKEEAMAAVEENAKKVDYDTQARTYTDEYKKAVAANGKTFEEKPTESDYSNAKSVELDKLKYKAEGDTYEIYYKDKDGNTKVGNLEWDGKGGYKINDLDGKEVTDYDKNSIKVKDQNAYRTKADEYATLSDKPESTARLHGLGARNREDIHDVALEDFERPLDGQVVKEGEGIMWHTHVTQPSGSPDRDDEHAYLPGQQINLSTNPQFRGILTKNINKNVLGNYVASKDGEAFSKAEFIAAYASSGQYSVKDLRKTVEALSQAGIRDFSGKTTGNDKNSSVFYNNSLFKDLIKDLGAKDWEAEEKKYQSDIENLTNEFKKFHDQINEWSGSASKEDLATLQCINGKFEVTLGNITKGLSEACTKSKELFSKLQELKAKEEAVFALSGEAPADADGFSGQFVERNLKQINEEITKKEEEIQQLQKEIKLHNQNKQEPTIPCQHTKYTDGKPDGKQHASDPNPKYEAWKNALNQMQSSLTTKQEELTKLQEEKTAAEQEMAKLEAEREELLLDVLEYYYDLKNLETTTSSFKDYFTPGNEYYNKIHGADGNFDLNTVLSSHDDIVKDFQDYNRMPVITNLSDYKPGDVIAFDDAHGYVYAVTGEFDPLSGTIKIACFTKEGKQVGSEISIWDQREIVPIKYVRQFDKFYEDYPDTLPPKEEETPEDPEPTPPGPKPQPTPPPATTTPATTTPATTTPATTTPATTTPATTTPATTTPATTTPGTIAPPETIPEIPVFTVPWTSIIYTGPGGEPIGPGGGPYSPHTGLDAIYGTGDTKQSATGLGALAGLAAGAAGLGLTGLIGDRDKDEEDEEDEDEDDVHVIEEVKPEDENAEQSEESNKSEETDSNPQFF